MKQLSAALAIGLALALSACGEQSPTMECFHSGDPTGYTCYPSGGYPEAEFGPPVGQGGFR